MYVPADWETAEIKVLNKVLGSGSDALKIPKLTVAEELNVYVPIEPPPEKVIKLKGINKILRGIKV